MPKEPKTKSEEEKQDALDRELDEELDDTFPASDPPKVTQVPARSQITGNEEKNTDKH